MSDSAHRDILALIHERPLLTEGAMGTMLDKKGLASRNTAERNLTHPEVVGEIHREYLDAGADIFWANSFVANRHMLQSAGLADRTAEAQRAAMQIVREAIGFGHPCGANVGPTGGVMEPYGTMKREEVVAIYREQFENILPEGPDFIIFETFEVIEELEAAFEALAEFDTALRKIACVSFSSPNGRSSWGVDGKRAATRMAELGADVVGANCGHLDGLRIGVKDILDNTDLPVHAEPNAGVPELIDGETVFSGTPEEQARITRELLDMGARIVGGCCGTTPEHIAAAAEVVRSYA